MHYQHVNDEALICLLEDLTGLHTESTRIAVENLTRAKAQECFNTAYPDYADTELSVKFINLVFSFPDCVRCWALH